MRRVGIGFAWLWVCLLAVPGFAQPRCDSSSVRLDWTQFQLPILYLREVPTSWEVLRDDSAELAQVQQAAHWQSASEYFAWVRAEDVTSFRIWIRLRLCNPLPQTQYWTLLGQSMDSVTIYSPSGAAGPSVQHYHRSDASAVFRASPNIANRTWGIVALPPGRTDTLYVRLAHQQSRWLSLQLGTPFGLAPFHPAAVQTHLVGHTLSGLLMGGMVVMAVFNFLLLVVVRDPLYRFYLPTLICVLAINLIALTPIYPTLFPGWDVFRTVLAQLAVIAFPLFFLRFSTAFLQVGTQLGRIWNGIFRGYRVFLGFTASVSLLAILVHPGDLPFLPGWVLQVPQNLHVVFGYPVLLLTTIVASLWVLRRVRWSWVFLVANLLVPLGWIFLLATRDMPQLADSTRSNVLSAILLTEMVLFTLVLMLSYVAQRKRLADITAENERLLEERNEYLEEEVARKESEVQSTRAQLEEVDQERETASKALSTSSQLAVELLDRSLPRAHDLAQLTPPAWVVSRASAEQPDIFHWVARRGSSHFLAVGHVRTSQMPDSLLSLLVLTTLSEQLFNIPSESCVQLVRALDQVLHQQVYPTDPTASVALALLHTGPSQFVEVASMGLLVGIKRHGVLEALPGANPPLTHERRGADQESRIPRLGLEAIYLGARWAVPAKPQGMPPALVHIAQAPTRDIELERAQAVYQRSDELGANFPGTLLRWGA